jgi:hypothetical protein
MNLTTGLKRTGLTSARIDRCRQNQTSCDLQYKQKEYGCDSYSRCGIVPDMFLWLFTKLLVGRFGWNYRWLTLLSVVH